MADPFSFSLVGAVAKPFLNPIIKLSKDLIKNTYTSISGVEKDVENLSGNLSAIKAVLEDAVNKQVNNQQLKDWLGKLKEAAFDAEDILETFEAEAHHWKKQQSAVRNSLPSFGEASTKYDTADKIKDISKRFDTIAKEKNEFHLVNIQDIGGRSETPNYTGFFVDQSDVVGREADKESITHMLLSNEFEKEGEVSVIPIIGMGGLGKTTLAQLVFNDERVSAHFESRMWVCVTAEFDLTRILKEMIQFHSKMKLDGSSTSHLQSRLLEFMRGQRFLLVLDDVWTEDFSKWKSLQVLLKQGAMGSRVLVTSRNTKVGDVVGTQPAYRLEYLPEDECWSLFAKIAFGNVGTTLSSETRKELDDIGIEIVRKCQGLPLAIKAMAGLLRGHIDDVSKWRQIQRSEIWEIEVHDPTTDRLKVMALLKLSYDHLPAYLKRCFEYCSLFPKSHAFYKEDLVKLWIAQGFIQSRGHDSMEEAGIADFRELLMRSFFQSSSIDNKEIFKMHDLMHDLAQSISISNCYLLKGNEPRGFSKQSRHVYLLGKDLDQPMLEIVNKATKLRSLLLPSCHLQNFGQDLLEVLPTLKFIRGLDLSSTQIKKLPDSIEELKLLRYLDLSRTEITVLPNSICNLFNLQTLKLLGCAWLSGLPKDLGNLVNLRHLELDDY